MRLFKSNKSHSSIDRLTGVPQEGSPEQSETAYPQTLQQHPPVYGGSQFAHPDRFSQQVVEDDQLQDSAGSTHPAHLLTRSQSSRVASSPTDAYDSKRPSVNIIPPQSEPPLTSDIQGPSQVSPPIPGQTSFGRSREVQVAAEKEHKRSKRSLFGLTSSKDKERERERDRQKENYNPDKKTGVGRSSSVHLLRKPAHQQAQQQSRQSTGENQQQSPTQQYQPVRASAYIPHNPPAIETELDEGDPYQPYHRPQSHYESPSSQYDSPHSPTTQGQIQHQSPDYVEDAPNFSPQREKYQVYSPPQQADSENEHYQPYHPQPNRQSAITPDPHQTLRPSSQASLGPPSPIIGTVQPESSRPSTAQTSRFSTQSVAQASQQAQQQGQSNLQPPPAKPLTLQPSTQQSGMARGDAPNGSLRQQMSQRDSRHEQGQYQQPDPRVRIPQEASEQGRNTPPPRNKDDLNNLDHGQLMARYEELSAKYSKVKRYYFQANDQVKLLQDTVANQRLSMSKTSLDDAQYTQRFERLSGAINNLAFNIRKEWRAVPAWLRGVCNQDAHSVGTKEMTAIGRACITRWLYDMLFERTFHPGLDPNLSLQLKGIERTLRRGHMNMYSDEQRDDLTTKVTTWRLTTVEGLSDILNSRQSEQYTESLVKILTHQLTESLKANLTDPPPPGLNEGVSTIVGQAVSIASNIPLESRDVCIEYYMPGTPVNETFMKVESGMTPLTNPGQDDRILMQQQQQDNPDGGDGTSVTTNDSEKDVEAEIREASVKASQTTGGGNPQTAKKSGFLGGLVSKKPAPTQPRTSNENENDRGSNPRESVMIDPNTIASNIDNSGKIRFAAFFAVDVRGRTTAVSGPSKESATASSAGSGSGNSGNSNGVNILVKASVYEF